MNANKLLSIIFCLAFFCALGAPRVMADEWNQATKVTFSGPVEIPGKVLPAGTYWFKLLNNDSDRNIVQVWSTNPRELLATIMTIPDYRLHVRGTNHVIKFEERPSSQPEALKAWFYPGDRYGHEFVYPETRARELAKRTGQPVLSMPDETATNITKPANSAKEPSVMAMKQAHIQAVNPNGQEVSAASVAQEKPQS